jgi:hypothetical protein
LVGSQRRFIEYASTSPIRHNSDRYPSPQTNGSRFGDEQTALIMYDTDTVPVQHAPGAECHTVVDGKITHIRIVFDQAPFDAARRAAGQS